LKIFRKIFNMKIFEERNIFDIVSNDSDFIAFTNELFSLVLKNCWKWSIDHNCHYSNDKLKCILIMIHAWLCLIREYDFARKHDSYVQYIFVVSSHICTSFFFYISYSIFFDRCQKGERYMWWESNIGWREKSKMDLIKMNNVKN
jgi:hypothetical protein